YRRQVFLAEAAGTDAFLLEVLQSLAWVLLVIAVFLGLVTLLKMLGFFRKKVPLPLDEMVLKLMEVLSSVPRLVLILTLAALVPAGVGNVVLLLCLTYWAGPARLVRAEVLKIKALPYVEAGRASGLTDHRLLFRHILPNAAAPLITAFVFGLGGLIGLEATLSFLGSGLPPETPSLGRMLAAYRGNLNAWWLAVFPAVLLYFIVLSLQIIGFFLQKTTGKDV
ncbi:MAG TPA: ABC transporter permease, partial [Adhaeribacter sp.]|nr:ABC transporter permease [Adhaeribacter sp.]